MPSTSLDPKKPYVIAGYDIWGDPADLSPIGMVSGPPDHAFEVHLPHQTGNGLMIQAISAALHFHRNAAIPVPSLVSVKDMGYLRLSFTVFRIFILPVQIIIKRATGKPCQRKQGFQFVFMP